ncbi:hypothetical protein [Bacillus niameyensis]|uniref:hypothetical protein n=1 Tax=Bacillus niameyensis TaxID=1522308 RepID=UPI0007858E72|nr:hypothetical protein [Bacillus niameyensis]
MEEKLLQQILEKLNSLKEGQNVLEKGQEEIKGNIKELKEEQNKIYELLVTVSERVDEQLDSIEALSQRVWNTEKDISRIQRRAGLK